MAKEEVHAASTDKSSMPIGLGGSWSLLLRKFIVRYMEVLFVLLVLGIVAAVFYLFPYKIAFLNFFYLPVLSAALFLGKRKAVMGAVLCFLSGILFAWYRPAEFAVEGTRINALLVLATWGGFLILAGASFGSLQERLARGFEQTRQLYDELKRSRVTEEKLEKVQKALYATMDPVVAFLATEGKLRFEKREISIMFTGLTDFTSYSDRNRPEVVLEELNRFRGLMEPIVDLFRGHIDKCMGDGVMVEFGAPVDYDRHALLAVLAGLRMQQKSKKLNLPWRMRIGIATGSTVVGMLGVRRQAYSAVGDRVNVAKRLEEICQPDKVYIDEPTFRAVEPFVVANKLRNLGYGRQSDLELLMRMVSMEERLSREGESAELLNELGKANFELHDATSAIRYFERAKVTVYEVTGLKDRWRDPAVIPPAIAAAYADAASHIEIPEEVVLAVEALDGAIGHCRVVALLSYALADRLKLNEDMKKTIMLAGYLQNLGKEAVPHHVLNRGGSLTVQESKLIEKYVHESVAACRRMGFVDPHLLEIVLHHHETWDGTGYPDGLLGENIPLGARITAVAEAYSALTSWRPYHEAWDTRVAMSDIRKGVQKGTYDPKVAEALLEILHPFDMSS